MKLKRENFTKQDLPFGVLYTYRCNDIDFFLEVTGVPRIESISVFKGSTSDRQNEFKTKDSLEAWNKFEEMVDECSPEQGSSGGFAKKPMENPKILPLLAIKYNDFSGGWRVNFFAVQDDKTQVKVLEFDIPHDSFPQPKGNEVVTVDWSNLEIPMLFKCEILLKRNPSINFEEDPVCQVFYFIPKSIVNQGGEEGGVPSEAGDGDGEENGQMQGKGKGKGKGKAKGQGEDGGDEQGDGEGDGEGEKGGEKGKKGKGKGKGKGEGDDESGEQGDGESDGDGEKGDKKGKGKGKGKGEGEDGEDEGDDEEGGGQEGERNKADGVQGSNESGNGNKGGGKAIDINFSEAVENLSKITGVQPSIVLNSFRTVNIGEVWLATNNFGKISKELGLPQGMTPRQLSQQIINSKNV